MAAVSSAAGLGTARRTVCIEYSLTRERPSLEVRAASSGEGDGGLKRTLQAGAQVGGTRRPAFSRFPWVRRCGMIAPIATSKEETMASERIWESGILVQPMVLKEQVLGADVAQFTEELAAQLNQQVDQASALGAGPGRFGQTGPIEVLS